MTELDKQLVGSLISGVVQLLVMWTRAPATTQEEKQHRHQLVMNFQRAVQSEGDKLRG